MKRALAGAVSELTGEARERRREGGHRLGLEPVARMVRDREPVPAQQQHGVHSLAPGEALDHLGQPTRHGRRHR